MGEEAAFGALIKAYGFPAAFGVALLVSLWRAFTWLANNVITPLTARQLKFIDDLDKAFEQQAQAISSVQRAVDSIRDTLKNQEILLQRFTNGDRHQ